MEVSDEFCKRHDVLVCGRICVGRSAIDRDGKKPLRAAMGLLLHIVSLAVLYLSLHAQVLSAIQVLVYAGAVVVLFVFVVMLIGPDSEIAAPTNGTSTAHTLRLIGGLAIAALLATVALTLTNIEASNPPIEPDVYGGVETLAQTLYKNALVPFEIVSITLTVAIVGAIAIARGKTVVSGKKQGAS